MKSFWISAVLILLAGCSAKGLYYYPNVKLYLDPVQLGHVYETHQFPSINGENIIGLFFESTGAPKGTILFLHGNYGNLSYHFYQATFLMKHGFNVFMIDYQGYGGSEGKPTPQNTIEDGQAAVRYALWLSSANPVPLGLFGQSIGAAVGTVVAAREPQVKAVVLEAGFTTYKKIMGSVMRRGVLTWPFSFFVPSLIAPAGFEPQEFVASISPRPVLFIHGDRDKIVPVEMSRQLFERALEPKQLLIVPGAGHLECRTAMQGKYEHEIADFFAEAFLKSPTSKN